MSVRNTLKELLDYRNLTVKHLGREEGKMTDIPRNTVSVIKNNKTNGIDYGNLEQLLRVLNVTPNSFFEFDPPLLAMADTVEELPDEHKRLLDILTHVGLTGVIEAGARAIANEMQGGTRDKDWSAEDRQEVVTAIHSVLNRIDSAK